MACSLQEYPDGMMAATLPEVRGRVCTVALRVFRRPRRGSFGFTIVEMMVAVLVFAICIVGICRLEVVARESNDRARWHYTAVNIAKNRTERARVAQYGELEGFVENNVVVDWQGNPSVNGDYRRTTTVSNTTPTLKEMVVTVEIRNRVTRAFAGMGESVRTYFADLQ